MSVVGPPLIVASNDTPAVTVAGMVTLTSKELSDVMPRFVVQVDAIVTACAGVAGNNPTDERPAAAASSAPPATASA